MPAARRRRIQIPRPRVPTELHWPPTEGGRTLHYGDLVLDLEAHQAFAGDRPLTLSHLQFLLLAALVRSGGAVVATSDLMCVASAVTRPSARTVPAAISRLRRELRARAAVSGIVSVPSRGYRLAFARAER